MMGGITPAEVGPTSTCSPAISLHRTNVPGDAIGFKQEMTKRAEWATHACAAHSARFSLSCLTPIASPGITLYVLGTNG